MSPGRRGSVILAAVRRTIGWVLVAMGLATLSWSGYILARAEREQAGRARTLPRMRSVGAPERGRTLGVLEVPRLGLSTIVVEGDDSSTLLTSAGHLPETPLPWQDGNSAVAAHRDTDFRPLGKIREGDAVRFLTVDATLEFVVRETRIVEPTDVSVLRATNRPTLTLITCYPFTYIGPAPKRFIVRAERTGPASVTPSSRTGRAPPSRPGRSGLTRMRGRVVGRPPSRT